MSNLRLMFSKEISIGDLKVTSPTVKDIVSLGDNFEDIYSDYLKPFALSKNILNLDEESLSQYKDFDLFFLRDKHGELLIKHENEPMVFLLLESLTFFLRQPTEIITGEDLKRYNVGWAKNLSDDILQQMYFISVGDMGLIDRSNFDSIAEIILKINYAKKIKAEKPPEFKNDRQRDVYEKLMEGRRRNAERNMTTISEMIDVVQFGGKSFISYESISEFTIQQLIHAYTVILNIDRFNVEFGRYRAGVDPKGLNLEYWVDTIKQQYNK